jgi:hypothetical protein
MASRVLLQTDGELVVGGFVPLDHTPAEPSVE